MSRNTNRLSTDRLSSITYAVRKSKAAVPPLAAKMPASKRSVAASSMPKVRRLSSYMREIAPDLRSEVLSAFASIVPWPSVSIIAKMACLSCRVHCTPTVSRSLLNPSTLIDSMGFLRAAIALSSLPDCPSSATQLVQTRLGSTADAA